MAQRNEGKSGGNTLLRGLLGSVAAVAVGVPIAGVILLQNLDVNSFKPKIEQLASEKLGRAVHINGEIGIALGLTPTLTVSNVTIANAPWAGDVPMVSVGSASVKVDARPLLEKRLQIREVLLDNVDLTLAKNAKGVVPSS